MVVYSVRSCGLLFLRPIANPNPNSNPNHVMSDCYIQAEQLYKPTYNVLKTLSEFAWAKTCVSALGFNIL